MSKKLSTKVQMSETMADDASKVNHFIKFIQKDGNMLKIWECGFCGRDFAQLNKLRRHLPKHTNKRNYRCDICDKAFLQLSTLNQHLTTHSTDRPYVCWICEKSFSRLSTLISHSKTHNHVKKYKCHFCPKAFHQKGNLRHHLFIHSRTRPYKCNFCDRKFNQRSNMVCHQRKAHTEKLKNITKVEASDMKNVIPAKKYLPHSSMYNGIIINAEYNCQLNSAISENQCTLAVLNYEERSAIVKVIQIKRPQLCYIIVPIKIKELLNIGEIDVDINNAEDVDLACKKVINFNIHVALIINMKIFQHNNSQRMDFHIVRCE